MITCPRSRRTKLIYEHEDAKVPWKRRTSTMSKIIDLFRDSLNNRHSARIAKILYGKHLILFSTLMLNIRFAALCLSFNSFFFFSFSKFSEINLYNVLYSINTPCSRWTTCMHNIRHTNSANQKHTDTKKKKNVFIDESARKTCFFFWFCL